MLEYALLISNRGSGCRLSPTELSAILLKRLGGEVYITETEIQDVRKKSETCIQLTSDTNTQGMVASMEKEKNGISCPTCS